MTEVGKWKSGAGKPPYPLYGLNLLRYYDTSNTVYIAEGEKAASALQSLDLLGITSPFGAKCYMQTDWSPIKAYKKLVILPDHDATGDEYAQEVAKTLLLINPEASIAICQLPGLPDGGDVVDWLKNQEELKEWDEFSPIQPEIAEYMRMRLLGLVEKHQQPYLVPHPKQGLEVKLSENCLSLVPAFPADAWPPMIWDWCQECAASMRIPPDYCSATLLVVFAALIGRKRQIRPEKNNPKWVVTPKLWGLKVRKVKLTTNFRTFWTLSV